MKKAILRNKSIRVVVKQYEDSDQLIIETYAKVSHIVPDYVHVDYKDFDIAVIELVEKGFSILSSSDGMLRFHKLNINELV